MKALLSLIAASILLAGGASGASPDLRQVRHTYMQELLRRADFSRPSDSGRSAFLAAAAMTAPERGTDRAGDVPPALAFLMSAALPGTGQLAEGRNRAFIYLGLEAVSWVAHFSWNDAGNNKEKEYQAYARQHWTVGTYAANAGPDRPDSCANALPSGLSYDDQLATLQGFIDSKNWQHYYEDIGKLEAYRAGWDDYDCATPAQMSPDRVEYRSMRATSNDYLNKARLALTVAFLNRVVSAVDAYRTARGAKLRVGGADVKLSMGGSLARPRATLKLTKSF
jgi:hypothetical protein